MGLIREPIYPHLTALPYVAPFPKKRLYSKQVWHDGHPVKSSHLLRRLAFFKIRLHGSEMILAGDFGGFGLISAKVLFGVFDACMAKQQLGRAQAIGLRVNVSREGPASLEAINSRLKDANICFHLSGVKSPVIDSLRRSHFLEELTGELFLSQHAAVSQLAFIK